MFLKKSATGALLVLLALAACNPTSEKSLKINMQSDFPAPPVAAIKPVTFNESGGERTDNYYWLKEKENPEVIAYLEAENAYCDTVMKSTLPLQEKLFTEMKEIGRASCRERV